MTKTGATSLMQRRREEVQRLGALAPQFSLALDTGAGKHDLYRRLPFRRSRVVIAIASVFLVLFSLPLVTVTGVFLEEPDGSLFSLVFFLFTAFWLLGWSVGVAILALLWLILVFGRETLRVHEDKLILRIGLAGLGFGATYDTALVRNFRTATGDEDAGNNWRGDHLVFDYAGEPVRFGSAITGERARALLQQLTTLIPQHASALPDLARLRQSEAKPAVDESNETFVVAAPPALGSLSTTALILANLIPLAGVILDNWSIGEIMLLFWAESAVIGFYNLCKMWCVGRWSILFYGPFFVGHYGAFMVGHLLFIYGFFSLGIAENMDVSVSAVGSDLLRLWPALLGFFVSHGISFRVNFLGRREYRQREVAQQMGEPYKRIIIMHVTIIFGGFLVLLAGTALPALLLLILLKVIADLRGHVREHR